MATLLRYLLNAFMSLLFIFSGLMILVSFGVGFGATGGMSYEPRCYLSRSFMGYIKKHDGQ